MMRIVIEWLLKNSPWIFQGIRFLSYTGKALIKLWRWRIGRSVPSKVPVVLLKNLPPLNAGETGGYLTSKADKLVTTGHARYSRRRDRLYAWCRAIVRLGGPAEGQGWFT